MSFLFYKKKFFLLFFAFVLFFTTSFNAEARVGSDLPDLYNVANNISSGNISSPTTNQNTGAGGGQIRPSVTDNFQSATEADAVLKTDNEKDGDNLGTWTMRIMEGLAAAAIPFVSLTFIPIGMLMQALTGLVLGMSSYSLDLALSIGVEQISTMARSPEVKNAWEIFRNLANIGIIFAILYIAIKTVLGSSDYSAKKLLGSVIIASLLINFSFFFGAIVVDVSNEMAITIYEKIGEQTGKDDKGRAKIGSFMFKETSPSFFQTLIPSSIDKNTEEALQSTSNVATGQLANALTSVALWPTRIALGFLFGSIANAVLAVVLWLAVFMIYSRVIIILFLLATAPIAFASMILPNTKKISTNWWSGLVGQSFFLPVLLLFVYIGIEMVGLLPGEDKLRTSTNTDLTSFAGYAEVFTPYIFKYIMVIGIFITGMILAKKVSDYGGSTAGKLSASVSSYTGAAFSAGGAILGRNTIGAGATALEKSTKYQDWVRRNGVLGGLINKNFVQGATKASFDARNSRVFKGVASATGVGGDWSKEFKPAKDGFKGQSERLAKSIEATYEAIPDKSDDEIKKTAAGQAIIDQKEKAKDELTKATKDLQDAIESGDQQRISAAKSASKAAQANEKTAQEEYEKEKNPTKASFIQKPEQPISIKNVWVNAPRTEAAKKIKEKLRGKEDTKEAKLLQKLIDSQKSNP